MCGIESGLLKEIVELGATPLNISDNEERGLGLSTMNRGDRQGRSLPISFE